jgi:hypothetical protein
VCYSFRIIVGLLIILTNCFVVLLNNFRQTPGLNFKIGHDHCLPCLTCHFGRAIAQAVSGRFEPRSGHVGFVVDNVTLGLTVPHSSPIIRGLYSRPISGQRTKWTQSHPTPRNYIYRKKLLALSEEPGQRSRYSKWLRAGRQRDRSSSPG